MSFFPVSGFLSCWVFCTRLARGVCSCAWWVGSRGRVLQHRGAKVAVQLCTAPLCWHQALLLPRLSAGVWCVCGLVADASTAACQLGTKKRNLYNQGGTSTVTSTACRTPSISPHKSSFTEPGWAIVPPAALVSVISTAGATLVAAVGPFPGGPDDGDDTKRCLASRKVL